jgi:hypothetical protein
MHVEKTLTLADLVHHGSGSSEDRQFQDAAESMRSIGPLSR